MISEDTRYVEHIYNNIYLFCEENLFQNNDPMNVQIKRILSVANVLYNNALRILRHQRSFIFHNSCPIQIKDNIIYLENMLDIVSCEIPCIDKDNMVKNLLDSLYFSPIFFTKSNMSEYRTTEILWKSYLDKIE